MTDDEARLILNASPSNSINWDYDNDRPLIFDLGIGLQGYFTIEDLRALLHFMEQPA